MDKTTELIILENNELINLSDEEVKYLSDESKLERYKLIERLNYLTKELK